MTVIKASKILCWVWGVSFVLFVAGPLIGYFRGGIGADTLKNCLQPLVEAYVPYIGAIAAFTFAVHRKERQGIVSGTAFGIATVFSLFWNVVLIAFTIRLAWFGTTIEEATELVKEIGPRLSILVAPTIGYFFGKPD